MNRIEEVFKNKKAFIPFITAGDPSIEKTEELIIAMEKNGADLIEIGIPFSDPMAEGIVIQDANERSLLNGTTTDDLFEMVKRVSKKINIPLVFMTYYNPVFSYGLEKFLKNCKDSGICGLIIPDLPFEEQGELKPLCKEYNITLISMIAPTSLERTREIAINSEGFIYCVSSLGVTGERTSFSDNLNEMIGEIKKYTNTPCAIGFGISNEEQAKEMSRIGDGVIMGSTIVKAIGDNPDNCVEVVGDIVNKIKSAIE